MVEFINNFEYKNLSIEGLDTRKHESELNKYRNDGWIIFRSTPDANTGLFKYRLKRPLLDISQ